MKKETKKSSVEDMERKIDQRIFKRIKAIAKKRHEELAALRDDISIIQESFQLWMDKYDGPLSKEKHAEESFGREGLARVADYFEDARDVTFALEQALNGWSESLGMTLFALSSLKPLGKKEQRK